MELLNVANEVVTPTLAAMDVQAANMPDSNPLVPPGVETPFNRMIGVGKWIAMGIAALGLLVIGGKMAWDSRRGETTEEVGGLVKVVFAVVVISAGISVLGFIVGGTGG